MTIDQAMQAALGHHQAGRLPEAEAAYRQILAHVPRHARALHLLGVLAGQVGRRDVALELIEQALRVDPNSAHAHGDLGVFLMESGRLDEAITAQRCAISLAPDYAAAHSNLGAALTMKREFSAAVAACQRAIELAPEYADAFFNLGSALRGLGRIDEAIVALRRAIELRPEHAHSHRNLGWLLLVKEDFKNGWRELNWRERMPTRDWGPARRWSQPRWDGKELAGKRILLFADEGLGDTINFIRYVPLVAARGGHVIVECQPELHRLLSNYPGAQSVLANGAMLPPFDVQCPLALLPGIFTVDLVSIPSATPPILPDQNIVESWRQRVGAPSGKLRVGLVWRSGSTFVTHLRRNIPLKELEPLADVQGIEFFNLQMGATADETQSVPGLCLTDHTTAIHDFADTAALIHQLDLVITVDTAVAHLAGAMGKKTWLMLPAPADWRWLLNREDSPWYPTMRLFRQPSPGDWTSVVNRLCAALAQG